MKKVYVLLLSLVLSTPSFAYYDEYGYDTDYSTDDIDLGYENYGMDDVYEKTSYIKKSSRKTQGKSFSGGEQYIKTGALMSNFQYKFNSGEDKYSTYGMTAGFGMKMNNEITADISATLFSSIVSTEKNAEKKETDLLVFSNKSLFLNGAYNFAMGSDFTPYVTAGVGLVQRKIEGDSVDNDVEVQKKNKDSGVWEGTKINEQAFTIKAEDNAFAYQFGAGVLIPLKNMVLDINAKMQDFGKMDKIKIDMYNGKKQAEDSAKITATTISANVRIAI